MDSGFVAQDKTCGPVPKAASFVSPPCRCVCVCLCIGQLPSAWLVFGHRFGFLVFFPVVPSSQDNLPLMTSRLALVATGSCRGMQNFSDPPTITTAKVGDMDQVIFTYESHAKGATQRARLKVNCNKNVCTWPHVRSLVTLQP